MSQEQLKNKDDSSPPPAVSVHSDESSSSHEDEEHPSNASFGSQVMDRSSDLKMTDVVVDQEYSQQSIMMGAGIMTGLLGCVFCGPVVGCLVGAGAAVGTYRPTPAGNVVRSVGHCAVSAASCSRRKVDALDRQHDLSTKVQASEIYRKSADLSTKVQESEIYRKSANVYQTKAVPAAAWTWGSLQNVNESYHIVDRSWAAVESTLDHVHQVVIGEKPTLSNKASADNDMTGSDTDFSISDDEYDESTVGQDMKEGRSFNGYATVESSNAAH